MSSISLVKMFNPVDSNFLKWCGGFLGFIFIQISVLKHLALPISANDPIQPDLVLLLLFFYGMRHSQLASTLTGFASGFFLDALGGGMLGLHALTKTVAGFLVGYVPRTHKIHKIVQFCVLFFAISIIHDMIYNFIYKINTEFGFWRLLFVHSFPSTIYSVFIGSIIYYWLKR